MAQSSALRNAYPFAVVRTATGYSAGGLQFPSIATADTRNELSERLKEQAALYLLGCDLEGHGPVTPKARDELGLELQDYRDEGIEPEIAYAEPAPVSVASVAIERALRQERVSYAELARRMEVSRSVVTRITNPFYFGHTSRTLRSVAQALGREVHVSLEKPNGIGAQAQPPFGITTP